VIGEMKFVCGETFCRHPSSRTAMGKRFLQVSMPDDDYDGCKL
jgi:hypothetical protein